MRASLSLSPSGALAWAGGGDREDCLWGPRLHVRGLSVAPVGDLTVRLFLASRPPSVQGGGGLNKTHASWFLCTNMPPPTLLLCRKDAGARYIFPQMGCRRRHRTGAAVSLGERSEVVQRWR